MSCNASDEEASGHEEAADAASSSASAADESSEDEYPEDDKVEEKMQLSLCILHFMAVQFEIRGKTSQILARLGYVDKAEENISADTMILAKLSRSALSWRDMLDPKLF